MMKYEIVKKSKKVSKDYHWKLQTVENVYSQYKPFCNPLR